MALLQRDFFMYLNSGINSGDQKIVINEVLATIMGAIMMRIYSFKSLFQSLSKSLS